jgi:hypothetical protein
MSLADPTASSASQAAIVVHVQPSAGAPWWATPLVAGVFALLGVAIAQIVSVRLDRRKREREQAVRLDSAVREAISSYLVDMHALTMQILDDVRGKPFGQWDHALVTSNLLRLSALGIGNSFLLPEQLLRLVNIADRAVLVLLASGKERPDDTTAAIEHFEDTMDLLYAELSNKARVYFGLPPIDDVPDTGEEYRRISQGAEFERARSGIGNGSDSN